MRKRGMHTTPKALIGDAVTEPTMPPPAPRPPWRPDARLRTMRAAGIGLLLLGLWATALASDALGLVQAVYHRPAGRDLSTVGRMELADGGRAPRVRELATYRVDKGNGETDSLVRFLAPDDIAGTGLLSSSRADGSTDQWLYLPELDRVRRIAGDRKGGRFVGSELYFEDLQERKPSMDRHRLLGQETLDEIVCHVVESVPVEPANSVYRKRVSWIDDQTAMVLRIDYYEKDDSRPSKRWEALQRQKIQGYWTVTDSRMTDLASARETRLVVKIAKYDRKLPAHLFSPRALADERFEADYRP